MAWWGSKDPKDDGPPELKDLTPEQIAAAVRESQATKAELAAQKTANDALAARLQTLEQHPNNRAVEPVKSDPAKPVSFLEDEDLAFAQRSAPIVAAVYTMGASTARQTFEGGLSGVDKAMFAKFGSEVEEAMKSVDAPSRANPATWRKAWSMVKGDHLEEITKAAQDKTEFFAEVSSGSPLGGPFRTSLPDDRLTDQEAAVAAKYGIKAEDYLAQRKAMQVYHD